MTEAPDPVGAFRHLLAGAEGEGPSPRQAELRRVGGALRALIAGVVGTAATEEELAAVAARLEELVAVVGPWPQAQGSDPTESSLSGHPGGFLDNSPVMGGANAIAPPLDITVEDGRVVGSARFNRAYQGPPGCVHGGWIAAAFDEVLGTAQGLTGGMGMTASLTVNYRRPTPLHRDLRFEGELVRQDGRKIFTSGRCLLDGVVTAEAEGLFISVDFERIAALYGR